MLLAAAYLAFTGIGTYLSGHAPMTHWVLMAHVGVAPVFAIALAFVALTWSDHNRFRNDGPPSCVGRLLYWVILFCGLIIILSGMVPMLPLFGTDGQHFLYLTHRYVALVFTAAVIGHFATRK